MLDINTCTNQIIKTNTIVNVIKLTEKLIELNYNVKMILDIDETVLSSKIRRKFVEKDIYTLDSLPNDIIPAF